jgi:hypothetical protein
MTPAEIGAAGEQHATTWLTANGYACHRNTQLPGSTDIEATSLQAKLLVQVKTGLSPGSAPELSGDERRNITSRASNLGHEAWLAQMQVDRKAALVGQIRWTKLN